MSPFIHGFQDHMTSWMSSLISQQNGCTRMVVQQAHSLRQERLEQQAVAMRTPGGASPDRDHVQILRERLAHRDAQLEHVRSQWDTHFVQAEAQIRGMQEFNSAQIQQLADNLCRNELEHQELPMRDACSWRHKAFVCHKTWNKLWAW